MSSYLVTGSNRGLGFALVARLISFPTTEVGVVFAATRGSDPGEQLGALIKQASGRVEHVVLDVSKPEDPLRAASSVVDIQKRRGQGGLDVIINNAGVQDMPNGPVDLTVDEIQRVFNINVLAPHRIAQAFLPLLRQGNAKKLINISSTVGSLTYNQIGVYDIARYPAYKISKAALNALTIQWATELEAEGFTVMAISPGWLQTDMGGANIALLPVEQGAASVVDIVKNEGRESTRRFRNITVDGVKEHGRLPYDGKDAPW